MMSIRTFISELCLFGLKQAYACIFGGFLLLLMLGTSYWYPLESIHRYDFLFLAAIIFQIILILTKLETIREVFVIVIFHLVATVMEVFKTSDAIGSWLYPEDYFFGIGNMPLFTGFMYSAVGSYIARVWRIFDFKFVNYPSRAYSFFLVTGIYINFFTHHYVLDFRWLLIGITLFLFRKTIIHYKIIKTHRTMSLLVGWCLVALFIWLAENIATFANIWIYPNQAETWRLVSIAKLSSWFLLMLLSFVLVSTINELKSQKTS